MAVILHGVLEDRLGVSFTATQDTIADAAIVDATSMVEAYLGYAIESVSITEVVNGNGTPYLMVKHKEITAVTSVTYVDDSSVEDADEYRIAPCGCVLLKIDGYTWVEGNANYSVVYTGGWAADDIPQVIKTIITDLALMLYNSFGTVGLDSIKVEQVAYRYAEATKDLTLSDRQKTLLNKYRCRRVG